MALHPYLGTVMYSTDSGSTYTAIGEITKIVPPKATIGESKTSHLGSTSAAHTSQAGWITPGDLQVSCNFAKTMHGTLETQFAARSNWMWKIRLNDGSTSTNGSTIVFTGYLKEIGLEEFSDDSENPITTSFTVKVTGIHTFTAGS